MPDDDQDNVSLDWRQVKHTARKRVRSGNRTPSSPGEQRTPAAPSAQMLAFPAGRRIGEIRRLAQQMLKLSAERGEAHLHHQLSVKAQALRRRGFSQVQAYQQVKSLEAGVRAELWRLAFAPSSHRGGPQR
jgi:hypothetical protein